MRSTHRTASVVAGLLALAAALSACSDGQPMAAGRPAQPLPPRALQEYACTGSIAGGVSCTPVRQGGGQGAAVIYGSQNVDVKLTSSNVSYDSVTQIYQFDVTVKNLMKEAVGTPDGTVADPDGIQVFFHTGPSVTSGTGEAYVYNPDGYGTFTATNQPYFAYHEILAKDQVSASKRWQLSMPPTVGTFSFTLLLETDVQYLLVINEVLANPGGTIADTDGEWFEVYNAGSRSVNLQNLVIADSSTAGRRPYHVIGASLTVPSGGYVTLGETTDMALNGGVTVNYAYGTALALANSVDAIKISRVYGTDTLTVDRVSYANGTVSAKNGISRELTNPYLDNAAVDGGNWADALTSYSTGNYGTPGAQNSTFVP